MFSFVRTSTDPSPLHMYLHSDSTNSRFRYSRFLHYIILQHSITGFLSLRSATVTLTAFYLPQTLKTKKYYNSKVKNYKNSNVKNVYYFECTVNECRGILANRGILTSVLNTFKNEQLLRVFISLNFFLITLTRYPLFTLF